jgi:glycosyltransferase involved in cell wall biosynthesis
MRRITALLHTKNDERRIGRCLETLYPCDEIVIVDHGSSDQTLRVAREYGAKILPGKNGAAANEYARGTGGEWILCLDPHESLTEALAASLFDWKSQSVTGEAFSFRLREETPEGWIQNATAQTRLVSSNWKDWEGLFPMRRPSAIALDGELLRFVFP